MTIVKQVVQRSINKCIRIEFISTYFAILINEESNQFYQNFQLGFLIHPLSYRATNLGMTSQAQRARAKMQATWHVVASCNKFLMTNTS